MNARSRLNVVATCGMSAWLLMTVSGCPDSSPPVMNQSGTAPAAQAGHDQGHDHAHGHEETGPHGGHIVEIGDEQLHAEWTHDDAGGEVVVYLLDSSAKADASISENTVLITTKIGDDETTYELPAVSSAGGQSSRFTLTDPALVEALKVVGPGVEATIAVKVNDEVLLGKFEKHEHAGHQH